MPTDATDTDAARATLRAIEHLRDLEGQVGTARIERDNAVARMRDDDGTSAPDIARATGLSLSNVRMILKVHDAKST